MPNKSIKHAEEGAAEDLETKVERGIDGHGRGDNGQGRWQSLIGCAFGAEGLRVFYLILKSYPHIVFCSLAVAAWALTGHVTDPREFL